MENMILIAKQAVKMPKPNILFLIGYLIIIVAIPIAIVCIVKSVKKRNRQRQAEQEAKIQAEKQKQRADEERRHQEILQAIRESGKMPEDNK